MKELNAETVTTVAISFLKRIGHKGGLKPKRVSLEEETYTVEIEMKKLSAIIQVDAKSHEIKAYEIQTKGEETPFLPVSVKAIIVVAGLAVGAQLALNFALRIFGM